MAYTISDGTPVYPNQTSYQLITLTSNIVLSWPDSFTTGSIVAGYSDVNPDQAGWTITLPDATLADDGTDIIFSNISAFTFSILNNSGTSLLTINPGQIIDFKLVDPTTSAGVWRTIPFGGGTSDIVSFTAQSTDGSITITNGAITPPGGVINFALPASITNLNNLGTAGIPIIKSNAPLTWQTVEITAGSSMVVSNGDGVDGNPIVALSPSVSGVSSLEVGNFAITGSNLDAIDTDTDLLFTTAGTGQLDLNTVLIDVDGNVTGVNNLTIDGVFNNIFTPTAWGTFTDTISGLSNTIVVEDQANISSITGGAGTYTVTFVTGQPTINYAVILSSGTTGGSSPTVTHARLIPTSRNTSSFEISVFDASGELVLSAPNGVSFIVMSS